MSNIYLVFIFCIDYWVSIVMPIVAVQQNLALQQWNIHNPSSNHPCDIIQAFNNPAWNFARMNGQKKQVAVADIFVRMGKNVL